MYIQILKKDMQNNLRYNVQLVISIEEWFLYILHVNQDSIRQSSYNGRKKRYFNHYGSKKC